MNVNKAICNSSQIGEEDKNNGSKNEADTNRPRTGEVRVTKKYKFTKIEKGKSTTVPSNTTETTWKADNSENEGGTQGNCESKESEIQTASKEHSRCVTRNHLICNLLEDCVVKYLIRREVLNVDEESQDSFEISAEGFDFSKGIDGEEIEEDNSEYEEDLDDYNNSDQVNPMPLRCYYNIYRCKYNKKIDINTDDLTLKNEILPITNPISTFQIVQALICLTARFKLSRIFKPSSGIYIKPIDSMQKDKNGTARCACGQKRLTKLNPVSFNRKVSPLIRISLATPQFGNECIKRFTNCTFPNCNEKQRVITSTLKVYFESKLETLDLKSKSMYRLSLFTRCKKHSDIAMSNLISELTETSTAILVEEKKKREEEITRKNEELIKRQDLRREELRVSMEEKEKIETDKLNVIKKQGKCIKCLLLYQVKDSKTRDLYPECWKCTHKDCILCNKTNIWKGCKSDYCKNCKVECKMCKQKKLDPGTKYTTCYDCNNSK